MSIKYIDRVWRFQTESHVQKLVLMALADNANDDGWSYPSVTGTAQRCQMAERTVQYALRRMEELGWIDTHQRPQKTSYYRILIPDNRSVPGAGADDAPPDWDAPQGAPDCKSKVHDMHQGGAQGAHDPSINRQSDPSLIQVPPVSPKGGNTRREEDFDWVKNPEHRDVAAALHRMFRRNATTRWHPKEREAFLRSKIGDIAMEDLGLLKQAQSPSHEYRRRKLIFLLNNWQSDLDSAREKFSNPMAAQLNGGAAQKKEDWTDPETPFRRMPWSEKRLLPPDQFEAYSQREVHGK